MKNNIKLFVRDLNAEYKGLNISLSAGYIDKDGIIGNQQAGIEETFSIGMPVYGESHEEIGRLSIGLFKSLDYYDRAELRGEMLDIPVEYWRVEGYDGGAQKIKTYWQVKSELLERGDE